METNITAAQTRSFEPKPGPARLEFSKVSLFAYIGLEFLSFLSGNTLYLKMALLSKQMRARLEENGQKGIMSGISGDRTICLKDDIEALNKFKTCSKTLLHKLVHTVVLQDDGKTDNALLREATNYTVGVLKAENARLANLEPQPRKLLVSFKNDRPYPKTPYQSIC